MQDSWNYTSVPARDQGEAVRLRGNVLDFGASRQP
jgi:hypothetical protein